MADGAGHWAPVNTTCSNEIEKQQTADLQKYLERRGLYEDAAESQLREELLGMLDQVVKRWIKKVALQSGMPETTAMDANAKIFTFGSYRLGVHAPGADIDVLCVGPHYAKRETYFFGSERHCLEQLLQSTPGITEVVAVPKAYVPVLKIKFRGIEMDVLYANLATFQIAEDLDLTPNSILRGCDEQTVRSINGCRVTDTILRSVPDVPTFRLALKAIKLWAEVRGVYSNVSGYLGGVNMALMVGRICKWYPAKSAANIVHNFFMMYGDGWQWPNELHLVPQRRDTLGLPEWDPVNNERDKACIMPIITPCYPAMNSTYNVTRCTFEVMMSEFKRGFQVCNQVLVLRKQPITAWDQLFEPYRFFEVKTAHYVVVEVFAGSESDLEKWEGWVRSRIRFLVRALEDHVNVRPFPDSRKVPGEAYPEDPRPRKAYFLCLTKKTAQAGAVDKNTGQQANTYVLQRNAGATDTKGPINITHPVTQFRNQVLAWDERRQGMDIRPRALKQRDLPSWLFPDGVNPLAPAAATSNGNGMAPSASTPSLMAADSPALPGEQTVDGGSSDAAGKPGAAVGPGGLASNSQVTEGAGETAGSGSKQLTQDGSPSAAASAATAQQSAGSAQALQGSLRQSAAASHLAAGSGSGRASATTAATTNGIRSASTQPAAAGSLATAGARPLSGGGAATGSSNGGAASVQQQQGSGSSPPSRQPSAGVKRGREESQGGDGGAEAQGSQQQQQGQQGEGAAGPAASGGTGVVEDGLDSTAMLQKRPAPQKVPQQGGRPPPAKKPAGLTFKWVVGGDVSLPLHYSSGSSSFTFECYSNPGAQV